MKLIHSSLFIAALAITIVSGTANAATYSAVNDFSLTANPNGPWSYLYGSNNLLTTTVVGSGTLGIDGAENAHPIEITNNGAVIFSGTIASYGQSDPFNLTETLNAGDVLNFEVLTGSTYTYLSTGLAATITPATSAMPVPATFLGVSLALAGLIVARSIKTRASDARADR